MESITQSHLRVTDNAISEHLLHALRASWPAPNWRGWHMYNDGNAIKRATRDAESVPRAAWPVLYSMANAVPVPFGWFPDWELYGSGLHEIPPGGHLATHLDSQVMLNTGWRRERSVVLFLDDFEVSDGGQLRVRDSYVTPRFNRLVYFDCTDDAWHEVTKVTGPNTRRSISMFFWSVGPTGDRASAKFESKPSH